MDILELVKDGIITVLGWVKTVLEAFLEWEQTFVSDWKILNISLDIIAKLVRIFI